MLLERWRRIEKLFHEALARPREERASFLHVACSTDAALCHEVESLLLHEGLASGFLESDGSVAQTATIPRDPVPAGERIGPYTVMDPLGAGGMGEVYKARDQRLDRHVAISSCHATWRMTSRPWSGSSGRRTPPRRSIIQTSALCMMWRKR